jgi:hypothetical protein
MTAMGKSYAVRGMSEWSDNVIDATCAVMCSDISDYTGTRVAGGSRERARRARTRDRSAAL